ncbi:MAG TPA: carbohydrate ABC transporter permease [Actinoplanes sp.]
MTASRLSRAMWHLLILALLAVMLYPILWLLSMSVKPPNEIISSVSLLPSRFEWRNYVDAVAGTGGVPAWRYFVNSFTVAALSVVGNVFSCALAAYAFAKLKFRMRGVLFAFMLATIMLPQHVVLIPQYMIFNYAGLVDTFVPLTLPKFLATDAFFVFLIVQFIRGLPAELDDAARIDGCGALRSFRHVILPLARPALITTGIFTFIWTWNDFLPQLIYLNTPENYTLPLALRLFIDQTSETAYGAMFAMSVLTLIPIGLFFLAFQRYLVEGVSTSGMGGT